MTGTKAGHFLVVPLAAWGHVRPLLHLCLNLLVEHPALHLTLLLAHSVAPRVEKELASSSLAHIHKPVPSQGSQVNGDGPANNHTLADRLQIIHVASASWIKDHPVFDASFMTDEAMDYAKVFPQALTALLKGEGFQGQENKFGALKPNFMIFDCFQSFVPDGARAAAAEVNQPVIPLITFAPCNAAGTYNHFATLEGGGFIPEMLNLVKEAIANGENELEAWGKYIFPATGKVKTLPGLTTMYDYEYWPQAGAVPVPPQLGMQIAGVYGSARDKDTVAVIAPTAAELELETNKALEENLGKPFLQAGLQFPEATWQGLALERDINDFEQKRVLAFLDEQLKKNGPRSVAFASFGSAWFPASRPELARYLVESLTEAEVPFVFAYATELFPVPPELVKYVESNPNACAVQFAPQWHVLQHPATRFFVSHCGSNSTAEAMVAGVPLVSHPFAADQGEFTAMLEKLGVTIDLKQVKTFRNRDWKKLYHGGEVIGTEEAIKEEQKKVWKEMMGPKGDAMRDNMLKVRSVVAASRKNGRSKEAMASFSQYY